MNILVTQTSFAMESHLASLSVIMKFIIVKPRACSCVVRHLSLNKHIRSSHMNRHEHSTAARTLLKRASWTSYGADEDNGRPQHGLRQYRCIGEGSCGTVFEAGQRAVKISPSKKSLWYDFHLTNRFSTALQSRKATVEVLFLGFDVPRTPRIHKFTKSNQDWFINGLGVDKGRPQLPVV
jgi:hypothetical protein